MVHAWHAARQTCTQLPVGTNCLYAAAHPCAQQKGTGQAIPQGKIGILVTCDNGWEDRTSDEMCPVIEEVRRRHPWALAAAAAWLCPVTVLMRLTRSASLGFLSMGIIGTHVHACKGSRSWGCTGLMELGARWVHHACLRALHPTPLGARSRAQCWTVRACMHSTPLSRPSSMSPQHYDKLLKAKGGDAGAAPAPAAEAAGGEGGKDIAALIAQVGDGGRWVGAGACV